jgi:hypothetical protein
MDEIGSDLCSVAGFEVSYLEASDSAVALFCKSPHPIMGSL